MEMEPNLTFTTALVSFIVVVFIIAVGVVLLNLQFQKNLHRQQLANEELKYKHQLELLQSSIAVQEDERKRIAENLHDELGALLSISRMRMLQVENEIPEQFEKQRKTLSEIRTYVETSIASMRRISHELIPPQLEQFGLVNTLETITTQLSGINNLSITFTHSTRKPVFGWPVEIGLYRVFMELINNTIKHAGATEIHIDITETDALLKCLYRDNGIGLADEKEMAGLGLKSMEGRIKALGGQLLISSRSSTGFTAVIQIPLVTELI
ncbi:MAG: sensor histidine kinase [Bacteroidota bacterium]|jgi:signal transduction histidine kinase